LSNFSGLHVARSGILANQRAMEVTAHNIANANAEGYSRQRAIFETSLTYQQPSFNTPLTSGQMGTGVKVTDIRRVRNVYLDRQSRVNNRGTGFWQIQVDILQRAEVAFMEPTDHVLQAALDNFFSAWYELNQNPEDSGARATVVETGRTLTEHFKMMRTQLEGTSQEIKDRLFEANSGLIDKMNSLLEDIANCNSTIVYLKHHGGHPNDLLDERDLLLEQVSELADVQVELKDDGSATVKLKNEVGNDVVLVEGGNYITIDKDKTAYDTEVGSAAKGVVIGTEKFLTFILNGSSDAAGNSITNDKVKITSGSIAGALEAEAKVRSYTIDLDKLAYELVGAVNDAHDNGYTLLDSDSDGTLDTGAEFFTDLSTLGLPDNNGDGVPDGSAGQISVEQNIIDDLRNIAASAYGDNPQDGTNALEIAQLQEKALTGLGDMSVDSFYSSIVTRLGVDLQGARTKLKVHEEAQAQIDSLREEVSGVSLDEEMANMIQYQRAYQASARIMVTIDTMLEELINLVR